MTTKRKKQQKKRLHQTIVRHVVQVKSHTYQPSNAELKADVSATVTPEELARATMRDVTLVEVDYKKG